ncbi:MAG: uroporphyrinogen-III synthase [Flavobacteriales bacterium]|nr:uroporphyrinogen-III synthase [Flavobacteriales bacterium]
MKIKTILFPQPAPTDERSPYFALAKKFGLKIDFKPFIKIEAVPGQEFRQERITVLDHSAIVLTSRNAVDHFFRMCKELRLTVPESMKYFCVSESVAYYVQKYIVYRKRKVFIGRLTFSDLMDVIKKHKGEKFLVPGSDIQKPEIPKLLDKAGVDYTNAVFYRTVASDLSDMRNVHYDMLVFFSPGGIESLRKNFPDYEQKDTVMAAFGPTTAKAVREAGLRLDIEAPLPEAPSMTGAIELFLKNGAKIEAKTAKTEAKAKRAAPAKKAAKPAKKAAAKSAKGGKK